MKEVEQLDVEKSKHRDDEECTDYHDDADARHKSNSFDVLAVESKSCNEVLVDDNIIDEVVLINDFFDTMWLWIKQCQSLIDGQYK